MNYKQILAIAGLSLFSFYFIFSLYCYHLADTIYTLAEKYSTIGDYQTDAQLLKKALNLRYEHVYQDKLSFAYANLAPEMIVLRNNDSAKNYLLLADKLNVDTLNAAPHNVLYWKTRAKNYFLFYQTTLNSLYLKTGLEAFYEAQKLAPTDPRIPNSIAIYYYLLADESKDKEEMVKYQKASLQAINQAIKLKPNYTDASELKEQLEKKYTN